MGIRRKMAKGAFWLFLETGAQQISSFVVFAVIARLIGPEEYGLVALCSVVLALASNIINGLADAVISQRIKDDLRLSSLFWIIASCGVLLSVLSFFLADPFASWMGEERIASLLRLFSIVPFFLALSAVPTAMITASMNFRVFTLRTLTSALLAGIVGIILAFKDFGAYALVAQQIVAQFVMVFVVWTGAHWRPRLMFNFREISETLKLGLHQTGASLVSFVEQQAPRFILGYFVGPSAVGLYAFVLRICSVFQDGMLQPLLKVIYPAFTEIREETEKQKQIFGQLMLLFGGIVFPVIAGVIGTAPLFVPLFFGEKWEPAVPLLQLFSVTIATMSLILLLRNILRAHKEVGIYFYTQCVLVFAGTVLYAVLGICGLFAVVFGKTAMSIVDFIVSSYLVRNRTAIDPSKSYFRFFGPAAATIVMSATLFVSMKLTEPLASSVAFRLGVNMAVGVLTYAVAISILHLKLIKTVFQSLKAGHLTWK